MHKVSVSIVLLRVCMTIDTVYFPKGLETETRAQTYPCLALHQNANMQYKAKKPSFAKQAEYDNLSCLFVLK